AAAFRIDPSRRLAGTAARAAARLGALHHGAARTALTMDATFHAFEKEVEDWHWWYRVRRDILDQLLARLALDPARARILHGGCGTGGAAPTLARHGRAVGLDRAPDSFALAMDRPYTHRVVASAGAPLPFADGSFDVVCALDILEHLDDDAAAARELYRVCRA